MVWAETQQSSVRLLLVDHEEPVEASLRSDPLAKKPSPPPGAIEFESRPSMQQPEEVWPGQAPDPLGNAWTDAKALAEQFDSGDPVYTPEPTSEEIVEVLEYPSFWDRCCENWELGQSPLTEPWTHRPLYFGVYAGGVWGNELVDEEIQLQGGAEGGIRTGMLVAPAWEAELRIGAAYPDIVDVQGDRLRREADVWLIDGSLLWSFVRSTRLRVYFRTGGGAAMLAFHNMQGTQIDKSVFSLPIAFGAKYRVDDWLAVRVDIADTVLFGSGTGLETNHLVCLTGGAELRFGGSRKSYWPWSPRRFYWQGRPRRTR